MSTEQFYLLFLDKNARLNLVGIWQLSRLGGGLSPSTRRQVSCVMKEITPSYSDTTRQGAKPGLASPEADTSL